MRDIFLFLVTTFIVSVSWAQSQSLQPFETDNCTLFSEGTKKQPELWKHCCFEHDLRYWVGGELSHRDIADDFLRQCVHDVAGSYWSRLIYKGVRAGHTSPVKHRLHWGWGWTPKRDNLPLTSTEKEIIRNGLYQLNLGQNYVDDFILKYHLN